MVHLAGATQGKLRVLPSIEVQCLANATFAGEASRLYGCCVGPSGRNEGKLHEGTLVQTVRTAPWIQGHSPFYGRIRYAPRHMVAIIRLFDWGLDYCYLQAAAIQVSDVDSKTLNNTYVLLYMGLIARVARLLFGADADLCVCVSAGEQRHPHY